VASSRPKTASVPNTMISSKRRHSASRGAPGESYFELVRRFPLRAIETDQELELARTLLNELLDRDKLDRDSDDYLDVLGDLIERYERAHHPLPPVSDVAMLRHFIDSRDLTCTETAKGAGIAISTLSSILAGKRQMNRSHIEALALFFGVAPGSFLGPPE
jgi:HTH-type transcriptional regulator / antitoxin HigA